MNSTKLLQLADFLDALDPAAFDFGDVVTKWDEEHSCGTVCCAIGWTPRLWPDEVHWTGKYSYHVRHAKTGETRYKHIASILFDMDVHHADVLFTPQHARNYLPSEVAANIRNYVANGTLPS